MPAVAIETVIIIIVTVSFAVLAAIIFALYWLWRLLLEDRRCSRISNPGFRHEWQRQYLGPLVDAPQQTALLETGRRNPRISRREVLVDERSRRMGKSAHYVDCPPEPILQVPEPTVIGMNGDPSTEIVILDETEPPPPYEEAT